MLKSTSQWLRVPAFLSLGLAVLAGSVFIGTPAARADTMLTETFTFSSITGVGSAPNASFGAFDPALGTLNSVTANFTATLTTSGGGTTGNTLEYVFGWPAPAVVFSVSVTGNGSSTGSGSFTETTPLILSNFIGTGTLSAGVTVSSEEQANPAPMLSSTFGTETVTYNYTPAVTPIPAALPLFATGLGALGLLGWRRKRKAQAVA